MKENRPASKNSSRAGRITESSSGDDDIISRIRRKESKIGIVGLGQVGLPTALSFFKVGYSVIAYDKNLSLVEDLSRGITMIPEEGIKRLLDAGLANEKVMFSSSSRSLVHADVIIVCVPTPLNPDLTGDLSYLSKAVSEIVSDCMESKKLLIIESSIPPMTMSEIIIPTLEKIGGKRLGTDFLLAFCPERVSPGQALSEMSDAVRVIGVSDDDSFEAARSLYSNLGNSQIIRSTFVTAEVSKLAENAFRDVNIAFANELAMLCQDYDADVAEVIKIANTHPRVNIHNPGPGVGGPCLPKDPYLLISKSKVSASLLREARSINDSIPSYLVGILIGKLEVVMVNKNKQDLKIGILGVSYKPEVNDFQNSPTKIIISQLLKRGYQNITVQDPICKESFGMKLTSDLKSLLKTSECVIIATGHKIYTSLSPRDFKPSCIILDAARILRKAEFVASTYIHYMAPGMGS